MMLPHKILWCVISFRANFARLSINASFNARAHTRMCSTSRLTYSCIYGVFFFMVFCFVGSFSGRGLHSPIRTLKIINRLDSGLMFFLLLANCSAICGSRFSNHNPGLMFFSCIGKLLSHLRFMINLPEKVSIWILSVKKAVSQLCNCGYDWAGRVSSRGY